MYNIRMNKVILKRSSRILAGHAWIFSNELASSPKSFESGSLVEVIDKNNNFLGIGYINSASLIAIRLLTRVKENIDHDFFRSRIIDAVNYRKWVFGLDNLSCARVIFSEGDYLPGLIVDKYNDCLVVQILTLGIDRLKDMILDVLDKVFNPSVIIMRNDSKSRALEGLPLYKGVIKGSIDKLPLINEDGVSYEVDPMLGQKTGFFLDQRENRIALSRYISGGKGVDLFCYSGAWGLQLCKKGANVTGVDNSDVSLNMASRNAVLNGLDNRFNTVRDDVFNFLEQAVKNRDVYDFVILDPPAFVKSRAKIKEALRGYKDINTMAMRILKKGGILATSSCSYHIQRDAFLDVLRDAAYAANRNARLLEYRYQGRDHPVLLSVPETEYLKCAFLEL